jgi:hypothetical protein
MSSTAGAIDRALTTGDATTVERQAVTAVWVTGCVLFVGLALVMLVRRLSGAFIQPLSAWTFVGMAIVLEVGVVALRQKSLRTQDSVLRTQWQVWLGRPLGSAMSACPQIVPGVAALIGLASLTISGTPAWSLAFAWFVLIAGETTHWLLYYRPRLSRLGQTRSVTVLSDLPSAVEESEIPVGLVQQVTRVLEGDRESIHSLVRAEVAAHDRLAVVHLAFCPPLGARPELTAHALDATEAEVRITQAEAFGVRIEIRLPQVQEFSRSVLIEVLSSVTGQRGS